MDVLFLGDAKIWVFCNWTFLLDICFLGVLYLLCLFCLKGKDLFIVLEGDGWFILLEVEGLFILLERDGWFILLEREGWFILLEGE